MRGLIALTVGMGVLILIGTTVLVVMLVARPTSTQVAQAFAVTLDQPAGTHIAAIAPSGDRLAIELQGGGPDRVVIVDPRTGAVLGRLVVSQ